MAQGNDEEKKMAKEREVMAMMLNQKEDRVFEKTARLLNIEKDYVMKLVDLEKKGVKLKQRRFRDRVGKIETHLDTPSIVQYKTLEDCGRFRSGRLPINIDHIGAVDAAARRLKIMTTDQIKKLTKSDLEEVRRVDVTEMDGPSRPETPSNPNVKPRDAQLQLPETLAKRAVSARADSRGSLNSNASARRPKSSFVPGRRTPVGRQHLLDEVTEANDMYRPVSPTPQRSKKPPTKENTLTVPQSSGNSKLARAKSAFQRKLPSTTGKPDGTITIPTESSGISLTVHEPSDEEDDTESLSADEETSTSHTQSGFSQTDSKGQGRNLRPATAVTLGNRRWKCGRKARPRTAVSLPAGQTLNYSSHKKALNPELFEKRSKSERKMSLWSSSSIGSQLEREKRHEKQLNLLKVESANIDIIETKRQQFIANVNQFIEENPAVSGGVEESKDTLQALRKQMEDDAPKVVYVEETPRERIFDQDNSIASMAKCRYLRISDDIVNLDDINTLAVDQFKLFKQFKANFVQPRKGRGKGGLKSVQIQ